MSLIMPDGSRTVTLPYTDSGFRYEPPVGGGRPATAEEQMQRRRRDLRAALAKSPNDPRLRAQWEEFQREANDPGSRMEEYNDWKGRKRVRVKPGSAQPKPSQWEGQTLPIRPVTRPGIPRPGGQTFPGGATTSPGGVQEPFLKDAYGRPVAPNPAYGQAYGLEWDGEKWVKANPNADLEREAAELALEQRKWEMEQARAEAGKPSGSDLRTLMQEARQAMAQQRQEQAAAEQIAREMSDEEILASGREWRWDGNQMQYTDTETERVRLANQKRQIMDQEQSNAARRQKAVRQEARNSAERALNAEREQKRKTGQSGPLMKEFARANAAGRAQPVRPQDTGTPYGEIDFEAMYWDLIDSGMDPREARERVAKAMSHAAALRKQVDYARGRA